VLIRTGFVSFMSLLLSRPTIRSVSVTIVLGWCLASQCQLGACSTSVGSLPLVSVRGRCLSSGLRGRCMLCLFALGAICSGVKSVTVVLV
jgi:hypothetical protein